MSRSFQLRTLLSLLPLVALGQLGSAPGALRATRGPGVLICHHAGPVKLMTLRVGEDAVQWHVESHGDTVGACGTGDGGGDTQ